MPSRRREAMAAVKKRFDATENPTFDMVRELIEHPRRGLGFGEHGEGFEVQEDLVPGEVPFEDAAQTA